MLVSVVGARPNFVKCAPLDRALLKHGIKHYILHTGQHYSEGLSIDKELGLDIRHNLHVGSGSHGQQTGRMLEAIERHLLEIPAVFGVQVSAVIVYGDTNSSLAGALAAKKLHIPIVHVESGLRSFDSIPEETNRVLIDHMADLNLCPTVTSCINLQKEGLRGHHVGNIMAEQLLSLDVERVSLPGPIAVLTLHREENMRTETVRNVVNAVNAFPGPVYWYKHPRCPAADIGPHQEPMSYRRFQKRLASASLIFTDSGGVQEEAYMWKVPCVTLRESTERVETLGANILAGTNPDNIIRAMNYHLKHPPEFPEIPRWDGQVSERIAGLIKTKGWS